MTSYLPTTKPRRIQNSSSPSPPSMAFNRPSSGGGGRGSFKVLAAGIVLGVVVGMQLAFTSSTLRDGGSQPHAFSQVNLAASQDSKDTSSSSASTHTELRQTRIADIPVRSSSSSGRTSGQQQQPLPHPAPLSPPELSRWLDILGNYTVEANKKRKEVVGVATGRRWGVPRPLGHLPGPEGERRVTIKEWVEQGKCKYADMYMAHILEKLEPWSNGGITPQMMEESVWKGKERSNFASLMYQILDGKLYGRAEGNDLYIDQYGSLLLHTLRYIDIPDVEFALHNGKDLPVMTKHEVNPILAYAGSDSFTEVLVPCPWYVMPVAATVHDSREAWKPMSLEDYKKKQNRAVWRGSPNDFLPLKRHNYRFAPRIKLSQLNRERPDLLDAEITSSLDLLLSDGVDFACDIYTQVFGVKVEGVGECNGETLNEFKKAQEHKSMPGEVQDRDYKYTINLDGTGVSERYASQLISSNTVFKVDSPFYNYYSRFFLPYQHYIPIKYDMSDLVDQIEWANAHPEEAHRIMVEGSTRAREIFQPDEVVCYTGMVVTAYARLLGYQPTLRPDVGTF